MITLTAQEVLEYISDKSQDNYWFIGQRKWTAALANNVLKHESTLRANANEPKPDAKELGMVFLKDLSEVSEVLILDYNRIYIFNQTTQLHIIPSEEAKDSYFLAETRDCCSAMKETKILAIEPARNQYKPHPFLFASLLGSIPDDCPLKVKQCPVHNTWRFYHE